MVMTRRYTTNIIGIDCSTDPRKVGVAFYDGHRNEVTRVGEQNVSIPDVIASWIDPSARTLLALDAPLGWPADFSELATHEAGGFVAGKRSEMFNRVTDRFVASRVGKPALRVGADRIAMTAHWALELLQKIREKTNLALPLAWDPEFASAAVIEVYPAATLRARGIPCVSYKEASAPHLEIRYKIVNSLESDLSFEKVRETMLSSSDVLDAVICCLAGRDFLQGAALEPIASAPVRKEGWIWVRGG